jgi:hypothetical protein
MEHRLSSDLKEEIRFQIRFVTGNRVGKAMRVILASQVGFNLCARFESSRMDNTGGTQRG